MSTYTDIKKKFESYHNNGIFYAFSDKQFEEGMKRCGYDENTKLVKDSFGGFGTREAFDERHKFFDQVEKEIREKCTPEDIFEYEWWNHECGLTYNDSEAVKITQLYFPDWLPSTQLIKDLREKFDEANC